MFAPASTQKPGVDALSSVAPDATIGPGASIGPFVTVGAGASIGARTIVFPHAAIGAGVHVGDDCLVYTHVSLRDRVVVGHRVILHDGVVIGSDGFGFAKQADGTHLKIPQTAGVVIEDDVEIGANSTIDRPAVGETRIRAGTKIDNLVHIAHGVTVGRRVIFAAQVGVSGSTVIEDDVILAGQVGVAGHLRLGKGVMATAQSGIPSSIDAGQYVSGLPGHPASGLAEGIGRVPAAAGAQETRCGARASHRRTRGETRRMSVAAGSPDSPEFLVRHAAGAACRLFVAFVVVVMAGAGRAGAQQPGPGPSTAFRRTRPSSCRGPTSI